jgi:hypothetical protein
MYASSEPKRGPSTGRGTMAAKKKVEPKAEKTKTVSAKTKSARVEKRSLDRRHFSKKK